MEQEQWTNRRRLTVHQPQLKITLVHGSLAVVERTENQLGDQAEDIEVARYLSQRELKSSSTTTVQNFRLIFGL